MANIAIGFGAVLMVLGIASYFGTGMVSLTAMIPAAFGLVLLILGVIARDPGKRKHAMHGAAMIGLLGLAGTARALVRLATGDLGPRPNAVMAQAVMAGLMIIFVVLCVRSFINARRSGAV